jgi:hypothetical protein
MKFAVCTFLPPAPTRHDIDLILIQNNKCIECMSQELVTIKLSPKKSTLASHKSCSFPRMAHLSKK